MGISIRLFWIWCANRGWHQEAQVCRVIVPVRSTVAAKTAKMCTASANCNKTATMIPDRSMKDNNSGDTKLKGIQ